MRRISIRLGLMIGMISGLPSLAPGQQALEDLERRLPLPAAGTATGTPSSPADAQGAPRPAGNQGVVEEPGYLGIVADESPDGRGVRLVDVLAGGPAEQAGMRVGDALTSIDGAAVNSLDELGASLTRRVAGEKLAMVVIRGADALRYDVVLAKRPPPDQRRFPNFGRITGDGAEGNEPIVIEPPAGGVPPAPGAIVDPNETLPPPPASGSDFAARPRTGLLGVRVVRVTPELQLAMNLPEPRGALIVEVRPDSPARKAGLPVDAVIVTANGKRVEGPDELADIVAAIGDGGSLRVNYYRYGQTFERVVELQAPPEGAPLIVEPAVPAAPQVGPSIRNSVPSAAVPPSTAASSGPTLGAAPNNGPAAGAAVAPSAAPAPKSVVDENERLRARIAELEAQLKAAQGGAKSK